MLLNVKLNRGEYCPNGDLHLESFLWWDFSVEEFLFPNQVELRQLIINESIVCTDSPKRTILKAKGLQEVEVFHLVHLDYIIAIVLVEEDCKVWELVSNPSYPGRRASGRLRSPFQTLSFLLSFSMKANQQLSVTRKGGRGGLQ